MNLKIMTPKKTQLSALRCRACGAIWFTRAASELAANEERCLNCDGPLVSEKQSDENIGIKGYLDVRDARDLQLEAAE